jgi:hypothetical protein
VSRPGGQGKEEVAHGAKLLEQQSLGPDPSRESILVKGLGGNSGLEYEWGHYLGDAQKEA